MPVHERKRARKQGTVNFYKMGLPGKTAREGGRDKMQAESQVFCSAKRPRKPAKVCRPYLSVSLPQFFTATATGEAKRAGVWGREKRRGATDSLPVFRGTWKARETYFFFPVRPPADRSSRRSRRTSPRKQPFYL